MLTSPDNPAIKAIVRLHDRRGREEAGLIMIEGPHLLVEAMAAGCDPRQVFFLPDWAHGAEGGEILPRAEKGGASLIEIGERAMAKIATTDTPPPVIATLPLQYKPRPPIAARAGLGLILDGLRDPGNLGTILRTAWGAGVGEVWATPETADFHAPKVLRAAQGAHFHLRLRVLERRALLDAADLEGWWLAAADARAPVPFWRAELKRPCMICVGNEAHGLGADLAAAAREKVSVPLAPGVDSLNAAVGIGVILFEIVRREGSA